MSIQVRAAKAAQGPSLPGYGSIRAVPGRGAMAVGDPGIFGDIFRGVTGAIGGAIKGFTGGGSTSPARIPTLPPMVTLPTWVQQNGAPPQVEKPGARGAIERFLPGGQTGMMDDPRYRAGKASRPGFHWNKSGYFLKSGQWVEAGSKEVRNRRMNPLNPSAIKGSIRRLGRAKTAASDIGRVTIRKKKCAHR